ncbi:hypothetical protein LTR56_000483 [Elasticomyces elasticus]|nr:hypothetical protein LTR22_014211 [Elasticomyces elasticus]KAK3660725.1 hypothetical protein LTR56_000483 [Elasticomyces elasticus]KAK4922871.1 hypothetical protein LTR49_009878 [Elasticomyces elasticus]KAK5759753.1 hypothetical protein LTS12_010093 [Elasticomyces elasticus]
MKDSQPCILARFDNTEHAITELKDEVTQLNDTPAAGTESDKPPKAMQATVEGRDEASAGEVEPTPVPVSDPKPAGVVRVNPVLSGKDLLRKEMTAQMEELCAKVKDFANFVSEAEYREETDKLAARFDKSLNPVPDQDAPSEMYQPQEINDELEEKAYEKLEAGNKAMREAIDKSGAEGEDREHMLPKPWMLNMVDDRLYVERNIDNYVRRVGIILRTGDPAEQGELRSELEAKICAEGAMLEVPKACLLSSYGAIAMPNASMMRRLRHGWCAPHWTATGSENKAFEHSATAFGRQFAGEDDL